MFSICFILLFFFICGMSRMKPGRLNSAEIQSILKSHNYYRRLQKSSNMNVLVKKWHDDLAEMAHKYLQQCLYKHGQPRTPKSPFEKTGQNIHVEIPWKRVNYTRVVQKWYEEIKFYNYERNSCASSRMCGHYTQVVWADTKYVGCASKDCQRLKPSGIKATMTICNYGPAGNFQGKRPYKHGTSCSMCPKRSRCKRGLCGH